MKGENGRGIAGLISDLALLEELKHFEKQDNADLIIIDIVATESV